MAPPGIDDAPSGELTDFSLSRRLRTAKETRVERRRGGGEAGGSFTRARRRSISAVSSGDAARLTTSPPPRAGILVRCRERRCGRVLQMAWTPYDVER